MALANPIINGFTAADLELDAGAGNTLISCRMTIQPGSDERATNRLMAAMPDTVELNPGDVQKWTITNMDAQTIHFVGIGTATNTADGVIINGDTYDNTLLGKRIADFSSEGGYRTFQLSMTSTYDSGRRARVRIMGGS